LTKRDRYLYSDTDRYGNQRLYFKPPNGKKQRIRFASGTAEAKKSYKAMMAEYVSGDTPKTTAKTASIEWLLKRYMTSSTFLALSANTQKQRRSFYVRFALKFGATPYADLTASNLAAVRDSLPRFSARNFLKAMKAAYVWSMEPKNGYMDHNPAAAVKMPSPRTKGHTPWTMDDVLTFKNHYAKGSVQRKCLACLVFTAREISGVRTLGRADVRGNFIRGERQKTWEDSTTPVLGLLKSELGDDYNNLVWVAKPDGTAYSANSLPQRFSGWATDAGLPDLSAHGLRKSVGTILADMGASENTIMAVLAHRSAGAAQIYVRGANRRKLAGEGMAAVEEEISRIWN
jgi:integrase